MAWEVLSPLPPGAVDSHTRLARDGGQRVVLRELEQGCRPFLAVSPSPAMLPLVDTMELGGEQWAVYEYVPGATLAEVVFVLRAKRAPIRLEVAGALVLAAARAVGAAHTAQVSKPHGGLGPSSVLLGFDGVTRVLDFGAPRHAGRFSAAEPGFRGDVFTLAALLHWTLTGFQGPYSNSVSLPLPSTVSSEATPALDDVLMTALSRDPDRRHENAQALSDELDAVLSGITLPPAGLSTMLIALMPEHLANLQGLLPSPVAPFGPPGSFETASTRPTPSAPPPSLTGRTIRFGSHDPAEPENSNADDASSHPASSREVLPWPSAPTAEPPPKVEARTQPRIILAEFEAAVRELAISEASTPQPITETPSAMARRVTMPELAPPPPRYLRSVAGGRALVPASELPRIVAPPPLMPFEPVAAPELPERAEVNDPGPTAPPPPASPARAPATEVNDPSPTAPALPDVVSPPVEGPGAPLPPESGGSGSSQASPSEDLSLSPPTPSEPQPAPEALVAPHNASELDAEPETSPQLPAPSAPSPALSSDVKRPALFVDRHSHVALEGVASETTTDPNRSPVDSSVAPTERDLGEPRFPRPPGLALEEDLRSQETQRVLPTVPEPSSDELVPRPSAPNVVVTLSSPDVPANDGLTVPMLPTVAEPDRSDRERSGGGLANELEQRDLKPVVQTAPQLPPVIVASDVPLGPVRGGRVEEPGDTRGPHDTELISDDSVARLRELPTVRKLAPKKASSSTDPSPPPVGARTVPLDRRVKPARVDRLLVLAIVLGAIVLVLLGVVAWALLRPLPVAPRVDSTSSIVDDAGVLEALSPPPPPPAPAPVPPKVPRRRR